MNEFAMHDAARNGDLERMRQLIEAGVPVNSRNERGETPLHVAVLYHDYEMVGLLIDSGCDLNAKYRCGSCGHTSTSLLRTAKWGQNVMDLLLHRGVLVNGWGGKTPLMCAARSGQEEVAALLIRAGADINKRYEKKRTALHFAAECKSESPRVIQSLLEKEGLDLSPQDVNGDTPLHLACKFNRSGVKTLLDAGADTNVKNNDGETALSVGIGRGNLTPEEIRLFVQKGAFLENCDYECISRVPFLKENVLKDVEFWNQSIVNKFNCQSLRALNSIAYLASRLPNVDNFELGARHVDEVKNLVKFEVERNTFCNVVMVRPIALSALCVLSLIT